MRTRREEMERMARLYMEYLNGPFGKKVMTRLKEGESFSLRSQQEILKVTKRDGKAVVQVEDYISKNTSPNRIANLNGS